MTDMVTAAARAAAERLANDYGPGVVADVEAALYASGSQRREQFLDPVSMGSLIVSIAALAWTVYTDLKTKKSKATPDVLARAVRVELRIHRHENPPTPNKIIEVVVTEIINVAKDDG